MTVSRLVGCLDSPQWDLISLFVHKYQNQEVYQLMTGYRIIRILTSAFEYDSSLEEQLEYYIYHRIV